MVPQCRQRQADEREAEMEGGGEVVRGRCRRTVRKALETEKPRRQAAGPVPRLLPRSPAGGAVGAVVPLIPGPSCAWSLAAPGSLAFIRGWLMARKIGQGRCGIETSVRFIPNYLICLPPLLFMAGIYRAISGARPGQDEHEP